jgi:hypothetical protein
MKKFGAKEVAALLDAVVSLALFFVGKYAPQAFEDVKFVIVALQPLVIAYIFSVMADDAAKLRAGVRYSSK